MKQSFGLGEREVEGWDAVTQDINGAIWHGMSVWQSQRWIVDEHQYRGDIVVDGRFRRRSKDFAPWSRDWTQSGIVTPHGSKVVVGRAAPVDCGTQINGVGRRRSLFGELLRSGIDSRYATSK